MFGFLNIYKPAGKTSHDVVSILRRITKIKQIGHTGTLDPFAEGVLPVCIGKATKLIEYLKDDKAYIGTVKLCTATTTYDTEGEITHTGHRNVVSQDEIEAVLSKFRGEIYQTPPIYSAIKVNGKKLYEYARKGEEVEIQPRKVNISKIDMINFNSQANELEIYIECSKGTYIRSLANDIGEVLGTYGHLNKLIRVKAGDFVIADSVKLENLQNADDIAKHLIYPLEYLNFPAYELNDKEYERIANGNFICAKTDDGTVILTKDRKITAIGFTEDNLIKPQKVFI